MSETKITLNDFVHLDAQQLVTFNGVSIRILNELYVVPITILKNQPGVSGNVLVCFCVSISPVRE